MGELVQVVERLYPRPEGGMQADTWEVGGRL